MAARPLVLTAALLASTPASAVHLCVDEQGHKHYQQSPCPELDIRSGIQPVRTAVLDQAAVLETLKRFDEAQMKRDVKALAGLLAPDFKAISYERLADGSRHSVIRYNRRTFVNTAASSFDVISAYRVTRSGCKVTIDGDVGTAECDVLEAGVVTSHESRYRLRDRAQVVARDGQVLVQHVEQEYLDGVVETKSLRPQH